MFFHSQLCGFLHILSLLSLLPPLAASPMDPFKVSLIPQTTRDAFPKLLLTRGFTNSIFLPAEGFSDGTEWRQLYFSYADEQIFYLFHLSG